MPEGTLYTCPMDPEIVRKGPDTCPICGMALEPMGVPAGDEGPNPGTGRLHPAALGWRGCPDPAHSDHCHGADARSADKGVARPPRGRLG